jgi:alkylhydroperoxidase family enzyme
VSRLPLIDPEDANGAAGPLLARIAGDRGQAFNVYRMLANSPGTLAGVYGLVTYLWAESELPPRVQELVILRVAQLTGSDYEWSRHRVVAARVGVPDDQVAALSDWRDARERFDQVERAALALAEETTLNVEASAGAVAAVRALLGDQATLELVVLIGFYGMVSRVLRSLDVDPEPGDVPMAG